MRTRHRTDRILRFMFADIPVCIRFPHGPAEFAALFAAIIVLAACGGGTGTDQADPASPATVPPPAPVSVLNAWGDSLTAGGGVTTPQINAYPARLAARLGIIVNNYGIGGQTSTQIGGRQGGVPVRITLKNDMAGEPAGDEVTAIDNQFLSTPASSWNHTQTGTLGSLHGTVSRTVVAGTETYTFFADPGSVLQAVPPQTLFVPDQRATYSQGNLFWVGTNDGLLPNDVTSNIASMVAKIKDKRYIVLSLINGAQGPASPYYHDVIAINTDLANTYGPNFLDVRTTLVNAFDPANAQDVIDRGNDVIPSSLRADNIHLNAAGYQIVADAVADKFDELGW